MEERDPTPFELFQSHAGSIEASRSPGRQPKLTLFQSHAGSIEAGRLHPAATPWKRFQSHAGSIEALETYNRLVTGFTMFQSHAGSIEAIIQVAVAVMAAIGFNPTLVRLRPKSAAQALQKSTEFQSHAGSIEAPGEAWPGNAWNVTVSIPRWFD